MCSDFERSWMKSQASLKVLAWSLIAIFVICAFSRLV